MCGRYAQAGDWSEFTEIFDFGELFEPPPARWNIAPCQTSGYEAPIVTPAGLVFARWWYIPSSWSKPLRALPTSFNARSEEIGQKPLFKGYQLCLVPSSGWREFPGEKGKKRSVVFTQDRMFAFGGIHTSWADPATGEVVPSFAILTTGPSALVSPHHDRMPLVVPANDYQSWVAPGAALQDLLPGAVEHSQAVPLTVYEASTFGNSTRVEGPECVAPLKTGKQLGLF